LELKAFEVRRTQKKDERPRRESRIASGLREELRAGKSPPAKDARVSCLRASVSWQSNQRGGQPDEAFQAKRGGKRTARKGPLGTPPSHCKRLEPVVGPLHAKRAAREFIKKKEMTGGEEKLPGGGGGGGGGGTPQPTPNTPPPLNTSQHSGKKKIGRANKDEVNGDWEERKSYEDSRTLPYDLSMVT